MLGNLFVNPTLSLDDAEVSFKELSDFIHEAGGAFTLTTMPSWLSFFNAYIGIEVFRNVQVYLR